MTKCSARKTASKTQLISNYKSNMVIGGRRVGYYFSAITSPALETLRNRRRDVANSGFVEQTNHNSQTNKGGIMAGKFNRRRCPNSNNNDGHGDDSGRRKQMTARHWDSRRYYHLDSRREDFNRSSWCQFVNVVLCLFAYCFALCFSTAEAAGSTSARAATPNRGELCRQWISSEVSKNGNFTSPNYPEPYPPDVHCSYQFLGQEDERVQILFTDFDLYSPHETVSKDLCEGVDVVMVFITIKGQKERVDNFCGNKLPPQLMSNGPNMTVDFHSNAVAASNVRGFRAIYRFLTNYGITSGVQASEGMGCTFYYNSTVRSNGTFMSPNYPGYYPRDSECSYFFLGKSASERVFITFAYFDVDGIPLCSPETASDYVEFSNFRTIDRKLPRHCGTKKPDKIDSDGDFFRVTFKSNDKFDATGFEAFYQFRSNIDPSNQVKKHSAPSPANHNAPSPHFSFCSLVFLICLLRLLLGEGFLASFQQAPPSPATT